MTPSKKNNDAYLKVLRADTRLALIVAKGTSDALYNANTIGLSDWFGSTDNLDDYDTDEEKAAYLRGRIGGDVIAGLQSITQINVGGGAAVSTGVETVGVGAAVGGAVALHGAGVGVTAASDIGWALRKLLSLEAASIGSLDGSFGSQTTPQQATNQQATSANAQNTNAAASNRATESPTTQNNGRINVKKPKLTASRHDKIFDGKPNSNYNTTRGGTDAPANVKELYKSAIPDAKGKNWYSKDANGNVHRFSPTNKGESVHWNGSTNSDRSIKVPAYVKKRLGIKT